MKFEIPKPDFAPDAPECAPMSPISRFSFRRATRAIKRVLMAYLSVCVAGNEAFETLFLNFTDKPSKI
jgi:hypothetical protein